MLKNCWKGMLLEKEILLRLIGIILTHVEVLKQLKYPSHLVYANLKGANLEESSLVGVKLRAANLSGANLYRAILRGVAFSYTKLEGSQPALR